MTDKEIEKYFETWLNSKKQRIANLLEIAFPDEALYREIMLSLGYPKNKDRFLELALKLPYKEIQQFKTREIIENALLYRAGFSNDLKDLPQNFDVSLRIEKSLWDFKDIRPTNYPDKRIKGISFLLYETLNDGLVNYFYKKIKSNLKENINTLIAKKVVENIMNFKGVGIERKRDMFFNIITPFFLVYSKNDDILTQFLNKIFLYHPPLPENTIIKKFKKTINEKEYKNLNTCAKTYFAIIEYEKTI